MSTVADTALPEPTGSAPNDVIVARAGRYYRNARYLIAFACFVVGPWFAYDGWVGWPAENARARQMHYEKMPRSGEGDPILSGSLSGEAIPLQKLLAIGVPIFGLVVLIRMFYLSRGEYRLEGQTLHVPGHPPVPLANIRQIDETKWDRKGIGYIDYEVPGTGEIRTLKLDAFVYQQKPTDAIMDRIKALVAPPEEPEPEATEPTDAEAAETVNAPEQGQGQTEA